MDSGKADSWVLDHPWIQQLCNAGESQSALCYSSQGAKCATRNSSLHHRLLLPPIPSFTLSLETRDL